MQYEQLVSSDPLPYDRRPPPSSRYEDEPPTSRRPPPPSEEAPSRPKPYASAYTRPFGGTQSAGYYNDYRRTTTDYNDERRYNDEYQKGGPGRQFNDEFQQPVPESATYRYGSTAYRNPATDYDDPRGDATR